MKVKLTSSMAGDRFSFQTGQVIECSDPDGKRLIEHGAATEAPDGAQVEDQLVEAPPFRKERRGRKPGEPRVRQPERATVAPPETAVTAGAPAHCAGTTTKGNPCMKAPAENSQFCHVHIEELPEENARDDQAEG